MASVRRSAAASESKIHAVAAYEVKGEMKDYDFTPMAIGPNDVEVAIHACGVCHSDLHQRDNDWGVAHYPLVPGHEIIGEICAVGSAVTDRFIGQRVGVTPQAASCETCEFCLRGDKQICPKQKWNYSAPTGDAVQPYTTGGFASHTRIGSAWTYPIPDALPTIGAAPLLCAGMTVFSPLVRAGLKAGAKVGIVGVGGLGHLAVQYSVKMGFSTFGISTSADKVTEVTRYGAGFVNMSEEKDFKEAAGTFDYLLSTISSASVDWNKYLQLLKIEGKFVMVGAPAGMTINPFMLLSRRILLTGSGLSSPKEVGDMLEFSAKHGIVAKTEELELNPAGANEALARVAANKPRYRVVLVNRSKIPVGSHSAPAAPKA